MRLNSRILNKLKFYSIDNNIKIGSGAIIYYFVISSNSYKFKMQFFSKNENRYYLQGICQTNLPVEATISNEKSLTCLSNTINNLLRNHTFLS